MSGGGFMNIKMRRGDKVRIGNGVIIDLKTDGEEGARVCVTAPPDMKIIIERGIPSPFQPKPRSDIG